MEIPSPRPPTKTYFGIQALRAIAALLVVAHHAIKLWQERIMHNTHEAMVWPNGASGVDIFFVISGFVMAISAPGLVGLPNKPWVFLRRRFIRIVPLYWIFTTLKLVLLKASPGVGQQTAGSAWHVVASYLFIPSLNDRGEAFPIVVAGWTLNYEMLFYFLFALALVLDLPAWTFLLPTLAAVAAVGAFPHPSWPVFTTLASPIILEFLFGVLLAQLTLWRRLPGVLASAFLFVGGLAAILIIPETSHAWRWIFWGIPAAAIVTAAVATEEVIGKKLPGGLLEAGNASYAIYLVHAFVLPPVGMVLVRLHRTGPSALVGAIVLALLLSWVAGEIVHRTIEMPLMKLFRGKRVPGVSVLPLATEPAPSPFPSA